MPRFRFLPFPKEVHMNRIQLTRNVLAAAVIDARRDVWMGRFRNRLNALRQSGHERAGKEKARQSDC